MNDAVHSESDLPVKEVRDGAALTGYEQGAGLPVWSSTPVSFGLNGTGRDESGHLGRARSASVRVRSCASTSSWPLSSGLGPLDVVPAIPRLVRRFTVTVLNDWRLTGMSDAGELIVSELATNVLRAAARPNGQPDDHGRTPALWLRLMSDLAWLQVEVWDSLPVSAGVPTAHRASPDEEGGRGLHLVQSLSRNWGWDREPYGRAKRVWALLAIP